MSRKVAILVGHNTSIAAATAIVLAANPDAFFTAIDRSEEQDGRGTDILYDPAMLVGLPDYRIKALDYVERTERLALIEDELIAEGLPRNAKKPSFLLKRNHHIRGVRR